MKKSRFWRWRIPMLVVVLAFVVGLFSKLPRHSSKFEVVYYSPSGTNVTLLLAQRYDGLQFTRGESWNWALIEDSAQYAYLAALVEQGYAPADDNNYHAAWGEAGASFWESPSFRPSMPAEYDAEFFETSNLLAIHVYALDSLGMAAYCDRLDITDTSVAASFQAEVTKPAVVADAPSYLYLIPVSKEVDTVEVSCRWVNSLWRHDVYRDSEPVAAA